MTEKRKYSAQVTIPASATTDVRVVNIEDVICMSTEEAILIQVNTVLSQLSACSFSLRSRLRLTSQLYTLAVLTSIIVSCSLRNSRSSTVFVKLVCAASSFDLSSSIAVGILYDSITFAFRTAIERHASDVSARGRGIRAENAPRAIGRQYPSLLALLLRTAYQPARRLSAAAFWSPLHPLRRRPTHLRLLVQRFFLPDRADGQTFVAKE